MIKSLDVTLSTTPQDLATLLSISFPVTKVTIFNFGGQAIRVGDSNVTSSSNGLHMFNSTTIELTFDHRDDALNSLFLVADAGTPTVHILVR